MEMMLGNDDDDDLLSVLASVFDCELEQESITETLLPSPPPQKRARRPRNEEIRALRAEAARLEAAVHSLQARRATATEEKTTPINSLYRDSLQCVALRQREQRYKAVATNTQLRQQVQLNASAIMRLQRRIDQQRASLARLTANAATSATKLSQAPSALDEPTVFPLLMTQTSEGYMHCESMLADSCGDSRVIVAVPGSNNALFDMTDSWLLPFDLEPTASALWQWLGHGGIESRVCITHRLAVSDNVLQRAFAGGVAVAQRALVCRGKVVIQRFVEQDRVVVVVSALVSPEESDGHTFSNVLVGHTHWMSVSRESSGKSNTPCTRVLLRELCWVDDASLTNATAAELQELQELFMLVLPEHHQDMRQVVENQLLDRARSLRLS